MLESPSEWIISTLQASALTGQPTIVVEREGWVAALVAGVFVLIVAPAVWFHTHPRVRVLNVGVDTVEVAVDGRSLGLLPPVWTEVPNAGIERRIPLGWRSFVARNEAGEVVDTSRAWVPSDAPALYAPRPAPQCFWIEQRGYGVHQRPSPEKLPLGTSSGFHVLPVRIDAWFQPNPTPSSDNGLFSGGIRRALRFGPCAEPPAPRIDPR